MYFFITYLVPFTFSDFCKPDVGKISFFIFIVLAITMNCVVALLYKLKKPEAKKSKMLTHR